MASADNSRVASNPTSALLQDMIREKKAQTSRVKKTYDPLQKDGSGDREIQSSPLASRDRAGTLGRQIAGAAARQVSIPKEMSLKEMEQHLSKISKQNFDLKLEIFHRRQRNEVLEEKLEKMEALESDNAELQSINEDLLLELEKRDLAIQEAVDLICELEAKIEDMGEAEMYFGESVSRKPQPVVAETPAKDADQFVSDDQQSPDSARTLRNTIQSDSSTTQPVKLSPELAKLTRRIPSFLKEKTKSTNVLRSLYSYDGSIFSGDDEDDDDGDMVNSPRLSILSESGFASVYGDLKDSDRIAPRQTNGVVSTEETSSPTRDEQRNARLRQWVDESNRPTTPTRAPSKSGFDDRFSSIGEVLEKVPSTKNQSRAAEHDDLEQKSRHARSPAKSDRKEVRGRQRKSSSPTIGGPMFGGAILPPTPGTMSTTTIAGSSSTPSIVTEKSLLDGTPLPAKGYSTLIPDARPQSSDSNFAIRLGNALAAKDESEGESASPRSNTSSKVARPLLTSSNTDTIFSGEAYATIHPSRTLSYPSPAHRAQRPSGHLSPTSEKSSGEWSSSRNPNERDNADSTPTKRNVREIQPHSPRSSQPATTPTPVSQMETNSKISNPGPFRSKVNKKSLTPGQPSHRSVASRLFRRSNSQSTQIPPIPQDAAPPVPQENSPAHARLPRPSSLYGSSPIYGQRPKPHPSRPSHNQREREHTCDSHRCYELPSIIPDGMLTDWS